MNKKRLLIVLFGVLVLSLAYAVWRSPRQERTAPQAGGAAQEKKRPPVDRKGRTESPAPIAGDDLRVRLDLLNREESGSVRPRHDLFAPLFADRGALPAIAVAPPPPPPPPVVAAPPAPIIEEPPSPPPPPPVQFTFLGFLQKEVERTVFLSAAGEIFVVKKGDRFGRDRQFHVVDLTAERLVIQNKGHSQSIVLSLADTGSSSPVVGERGDPRPSRSAASRPPIASRVPPQPSEMPVEIPAPEENAAPPREVPADEEGILRPLPRSNFNNIFSEDREQAGNRPPVQRQSAKKGLALPSEEVPR